MAKINDWVAIHRVILTPEERATQVPDDTKQVPLEMWVKGTLLEDSEIGDAVKIRTVTGRIETGRLTEVEPVYRHSFGEFVPEIQGIHRILEQAMREADNEE